MAEWPASGATDWNTKMLAYLAVEHNTDGTHKDSVFAFSAYTTQDSETNNMVIAHAYLATSDGFVYAVSTNADDGDLVYGYIDGTNDPAGAGEKMAAVVARTTNNSIGISFAVASGEYFEITSTAQGDPVIYWRSVGTLSEPVDQG